ncbi:ribose-5-phosphate isomerase [Candidatus Wolfebacteria bacterium]|nr:MAG: ribose-5-phosphate isomerase [Candidatus Wolfebacteria bacterium]
MLIFIGSDHAGFELKEKLIDYIDDLGHEVIDKGAYELNQQDDYPDFIKEVAVAVSDDPHEYKGIILGGSGQGEAMAANRVPGIRAAVYYGPRTATESVDISGRKSEDELEIIRLSREHNDANILSLASRFLTVEEAQNAVKLFLATKFSGEERHIRRIKKLDNTK